jgi:UDP-glucose-4-epimerase GalE
VEGRIHDQTLVRQVIREHRISGIVHFAAYAYVGESMLQPTLYYANNLVGSVRLLEAAVQEGVRAIVFSSSCTVYGIPARVPVTEDLATAPINPYGDTKLAVERLLGWLNQSNGLRYAALRYFNAAGGDPESGLFESHEPETHLIPLAIRAAVDPKSVLRVFGTDYGTPDGTAVRDYIHVNDLARAHVAALKHLLERDGECVTVNLGSGTGYSVVEVIDAVERIVGRRPKLLFSERRVGDPPKLVADTSLAKSILGWKTSQSSLDEIVKSAWLASKTRDVNASVPTHDNHGAEVNKS